MTQELLSLQQEAYLRGQENSRYKHNQCCSRIDAITLLTLASDFAAMNLYKERFSPGISDIYARASLRIQAFQRGYLDEENYRNLQRNKCTSEFVKRNRPHHHSRNKRRKGSSKRI